MIVMTYLQTVQYAVVFFAMLPGMIYIWRWETQNLQQIYL